MLELATVCRQATSGTEPLFPHPPVIDHSVPSFQSKQISSVGSDHVILPGPDGLGRPTGVKRDSALILDNTRLVNVSHTVRTRFDLARAPAPVPRGTPVPSRAVPRAADAA